MPIGNLISNPILLPQNSPPVFAANNVPLFHLAYNLAYNVAYNYVQRLCVAANDIRYQKIQLRSSSAVSTTTASTTGFWYHASPSSFGLSVNA
jgi:hypothetical protein